MTEDRSTGLRLAFAQGERTVDEQARALENLRGRAALLFSAAGVVAGLLAGRIADRSLHHLSAPGWVALAVATAAFVAVVVATVAVWRPATVHVNHDPGIILTGYVDADPPATIDKIHHWLAYHRHSDIEANRTMLDLRTTWFLRGLYAFPIEVLALLVALVAAAR